MPWSTTAILHCSATVASLFMSPHPPDSNQNSNLVGSRRFLKHYTISCILSVANMQRGADNEKWDWSKHEERSSKDRKDRGCTWNSGALGATSAGICACVRVCVCLHWWIFPFLHSIPNLSSRASYIPWVGVSAHVVLTLSVSLRVDLTTTLRRLRVKPVKPFRVVGWRWRWRGGGRRRGKYSQWRFEFAKKW